MLSYLNIKAAIELIPSGSRIFVHGGAATPNILLKELVQQSHRLQDCSLIHLHTEGPAFYAKAEYKDSFRVINLFVGGNIRKNMDYNRIDYLPCFLSEIPELFRSKKCLLDVALIHVSPPDVQGYCSLGVSVDIVKSAIQNSKIIIAQINPNMPRVHGDGFIHSSVFSAAVEVNEKLPQSHPIHLTSEELLIGQHVASLIEDRSTLQIGIGSIPNAVAQQLLDHKDLGVHSEMWSDGVLNLIESGVITNAYKKIHRGKSVSGFLIGSQKLYDFVHDNPSVLQFEIDYVNDPNIICRNPRVAAVNSPVEIDLTGQVCADSIGNRIISGVGGQMDFMRGAAQSDGGKPIIALQSRTKRGRSKIVSQLQPGAGVVTTRSHVHYVVTEYGIAQLHGKTLRDRACAMIAIAHPEDRETLEREFAQKFKHD